MKTEAVPLVLSRGLFDVARNVEMKAAVTTRLRSCGISDRMERGRRFNFLKRFRRCASPIAVSRSL